MSKVKTGKYEQKRVQCVKDSYYMYLPKPWIIKYGVDNSRTVSMRHLADDSLLIQSGENIQGKKTEFTIDLAFSAENLIVDKSQNEITEGEYVDYLFNQYLTLYIIGIERVRFIHNERISIIFQNKISAMTRKFHGMVIVSETPKEIVVEDTSSKIDLNMMIKQIINKVGMLITNYIEIMQNYDQLQEKDDFTIIISELQKQDDLIDEHRYAIERFVHKILNFPSIGYENNISTIECLHFSECSRMLERIGDYLLKISGLLIDSPIHDTKFILKKMSDMQNTFFVIQDYFNRDNSLKFFDLITRTSKETEKTKELIQEQAEDWRYLEYIRRIKNICTDIAEIRINDILSKKIQQ